MKLDKYICTLPILSSRRKKLKKKIAMILEVIPIFKNKRIWTFWHMGFFKWNFMELKTVNFRFPKIVLIFIGINLPHMVLGKFWEMHLGLRGWFFFFFWDLWFIFKRYFFPLTQSINRRRQSSISRTDFGNDVVKHCQTTGLGAALLNVIFSTVQTLPARVLSHHPPVRIPRPSNFGRSISSSCWW